MAAQQAMIEPFEAGQVREANGQRIVSYGTSSYGYDVRCANEFKIFTNINSTIVDPKAFDPGSFVDFKGDVCIIPPNSFALARTVEYLRIPRSVLTVCLGKSTYARCFRGDTRVALVDGSCPTLEEMALRSESGEIFFGYSVGANGRIIVAQLEAPRHVGRDNLVEITLDNDQVIHATPDHLFMLRDGRWLPAAELSPNSSLMPLYRTFARGYEVVYQPINGHMLATHRLADEWNLRHEIYADLPGQHRHHIDHDRLNNNPWNVERMEAKAHAFWNEDDYKERREELLRRRQYVSALSRERMRAAQLARYASEAARAQHSELMRQVWLKSSMERRLQQADIARSIRLRPDITAESVYAALHRTGSIRGAARLLDCDRSAFRRFPDIPALFRGRLTKTWKVEDPASRGSAGGVYINHKVRSVRSLGGEHDVYCLTVPGAGNFALESGVFTHNCGIIVNVTPLEPEWEGHVTLEFSNTTPLPAKIYAGEGCAQMLFFESDEVCATSYKDRGGKYQGQTGVTLPKT